MEEIHHQLGRIKKVTFAWEENDRAMERYICQEPWEVGAGIREQSIGRVTTGTVAQAAGPVNHLSPVTSSRQQLPTLHLMGVSGKNDIQGE